MGKKNQDIIYSFHIYMKGKKNKNKTRVPLPQKEQRIMANKKDKLELAIQQLNNAQRNLSQADLPTHLQRKCNNIINEMISAIVDAKVEMMNEKKQEKEEN